MPVPCHLRLVIIRAVHTQTKRMDIDTGIFNKVCRANYLRINLDNITHNVQTMRSKCPSQTGIIGVIKTSSYGHGLIETAKHLKSIGVERLATAVIDETAYIRKAGVNGPIHVLNCAQCLEIPDLIKYKIIPTVSERKFIIDWANYKNDFKTKSEEKHGMVAIKVDTGLSRNGIQPAELNDMVNLCDELGVEIDSIFTHFGVGPDNEDFLKAQLKLYEEIIAPHKNRPGIKFHTSASQGIKMGYGLDFDFIRPGKALFGLNGDMGMGYKACLALIAKPMLVKPLEKGRDVGYDRTYECKEHMTVATFGLGFGDGLPLTLGNKGCIKNKDGEKFPIIGKVSSGAFMVKVKGMQSADEGFYIISDDFDRDTSIMGWANQLGVMGSVVTANLNARLPKVYYKDGKVHSIVVGIDKTH